MYGAESLIKTLLKGGVNTCFMNPGTSEMHFVSAVDTFKGTRCILTLFEGVATGAADAYARILGKPATVLMHCAPGLANGLANLHNARRANSAIINIIGDQANSHVHYDPPLTADTTAWARGVSSWVKTCAYSKDVGNATATAIYEANKYPGNIATLILPSDASWGEDAEIGKILKQDAPRKTDFFQYEKAITALKAKDKKLILLGGNTLKEEGLNLAYNLAKFTNSDLMMETFCPFLERGRNNYPINAVPYVPKLAVEALKDYKHIILIEAKEPVAFFAYPNFHGSFINIKTNVIELCQKDQDGTLILQNLNSELKVPIKPYISENKIELVKNNDKLTPLNMSPIIASFLPENSIVVDESITSKSAIFEASKLSKKHKHLQLTGGAIGSGMPMAVGAAIAAANCKIVNLEADGSALYTVQALWTQAREKLNITTVIFSNRKYKILMAELKAMGLEYGQTALDMMDLGNPDIDWVNIANGFGVEAKKAETVNEFYDLFSYAMKQNTPFLIEAIID